MNDYIKALIGINKDAIDDIAMFEDVLKDAEGNYYQKIEEEEEVPEEDKPANK